MKKTFSIVLFGLLLAGVYGQSSGPQPSTGDLQYELEWNTAFQLNERDSLERWEERAYLHTDREEFNPGEHIFFKAYVVNLKTQQRWTPSRVLKLELRDSEDNVIDKQFHALNNGVSKGAFKLSNRIKEGSYQLLAYTRWMQNYGEHIFFSKDIRIGQLEASGTAKSSAVLTDFTFYPEGGQLIGGIPNRMVIYAKSSTGEAVPFEAEIEDAGQDNSFPVNTYGQGMGQLTFTPTANKAYYLQLKDGSQYPLPPVLTSGYTLKINNLDPGEIFIQSERQGITTSQNVFIQGWIDDKPCFENELSYNDEGVAKLEVSKSGLPIGKVDFRLVDENGQKLAERPVWITAQGQLDIQIEQVVSGGRKGDQHTFKITVKDKNGQPVQTDLSISVLSNTSEEKAAISNPTYELSNGRKERFLEDLKVLSRSGHLEGEDGFPEEIVYPIQKGLEIVGYAYDLNNELLINEDIQLLGVSDSLWIAREVQTDATGLLRIQDLDFEGDTQIIFRATGEDSRERLVKLVPLVESTSNQKEKKAKRAKKLKDLVLETTPWQTMDTTGLIELDPAMVSANKKPAQLYSSQYGTMLRKQDVVVQDPQRPRSLLELIQEIPGIRVVGLGSERPQIQIIRQGRGGSPLWILDGVPLNPLNQVALGNMPSNVYIETPIGLVPDVAIDRVEFVFGADASIYGARGASGVFLVYTRDGADSDYIKRKEGQLKFKGFTPQPDIGKLLKAQLKRNKRKVNPTDTLFWNPSLQTDEQGEVLVQFSSPVNLEQMEVHIETITPSGLRGSKKQVILPVP